MLGTTNLNDLIKRLKNIHEIYPTFTYFKELLGPIYVGME